MPNQIIDLRKLKNELKSRITPENELPPLARRSLLARRSSHEGGGKGGAEEKLLETEEAAHPEALPAGRQGFDDEALRHPPLLEWQAREFEHDESNALMLLALGAATGLGGIAALFFKNFLFAVFLFIAAGLVASHAFRIPRQIRLAVTSRGVEIGRRLYEFEDLQSFWIFYDPPLLKELSLRSKKAVMPLIRIPLGDLDPLRLREILLRFLAEEKQEASAIDIISKRLGF